MMEMLHASALLCGEIMEMLCDARGAVAWSVEGKKSVLAELESVKVNAQSWRTV